MSGTSARPKLCATGRGTACPADGPEDCRSAGRAKLINVFLKTTAYVGDRRRGGLGWGFEALMSGLWCLEASVLDLFSPPARAMVEDP